MQPGLIIAPSLKLARPLGRGGMGTVWVANHAGLGREVAVKFLSDDLANDPLAVARFEREAAAVAELKNSHIVDVIEFGFTQAGLPYMATELLDGEDLGERLMRERRIAPDVVATILDQICEALAAAHGLGIVHRDIKPENVFVVRGEGTSEDKPSIRLLDFGIAKHWQDPKLDITSTGVVVGTPHYMSPEQFLSAKHVDFRADLWSVGILAYRALTGRLPFEASSFAALCIQIHRGVFPRATAYRAELPPSLDVWFTKALRGHPAARFTSARQMADSFRTALTAPISEQPTVDARRAPPPMDLARRHIATAKLPHELLSTDGEQVTIDLASLFPTGSPQAELGNAEKTAPRRRPFAWAAFVALALAFAAVTAIRPFDRPPAILAVRPATPEPIHLKPRELPAPSPVESAAALATEGRPAFLVPGRPIAAPPPPRKTPPAPSPPKEPDRGF
jgi:eukaryotic-like serine/threonine-protein kinase